MNSNSTISMADMMLVYFKHCPLVAQMEKEMEIMKIELEEKRVMCRIMSREIDRLEKENDAVREKHRSSECDKTIQVNINTPVAKQEETSTKEKEKKAITQEVVIEEKNVVEEEEQVVEEEQEEEEQVTEEEEEVVEEEEEVTEEVVEEEEEEEVTEQVVEEEEEEEVTEQVVEEEEEEEEEVTEEVVEEEEEEEEEEVTEEVVEEEEEEEEVVEEEEEGVYEAVIKGKKYYVTNETDGIIYAIDADGEVGDEVGKYVNKVATFSK